MISEQDSSQNIDHAIALYDDRPFFETALRHGVRFAIITKAKIEVMEKEAPKGLVQIAAAFGTEYLRPEIELARKRIVNLASLYLLETSKGDLDVAAKLIRDNTFLTLSRGGSGLLKALFAMPEYAMLGREHKSKVEEFLEIWSLKEKPEEYRQLLANRQNNVKEIEAALWFAANMDVARDELQEVDCEAIAVVRTALLKRLINDADAPIENQVEFAKILEELRTKAKIKAKYATIFNLEKAKAILIDESIPSEYHEIANNILEEIFKRDFKLISDKKISLDRLVFELKERYFICSHELEDVSDYDALVSKEWSKVTKGKTDIDSLLTLFLRMAVGMPLKTTIPEKSLKTLVKKVRESGLDSDLVIAWIKTNAPHEKQEGLIEDWKVFVEEAMRYLLDDWDTYFTGAVRFLSEHCHVEKAVKK